MRKVHYPGRGGIDAVSVIEAPAPEPAPDRLVVRIRASCINPGTLAALDGAPFTPARDLAGEVVAVGPGVSGLTVGDAVLGWADDAAHAELASVPSSQLVRKPAALPWDVAGSLYVSPLAALAGVRSVSTGTGDVVVVSGAAGGVGFLAAQLARRAGATVLGLVREEHATWLAAHGIRPVLDGDGREDRLRSAAPRIDAFIDNVGVGHVALAIALGVHRERINTIVDFAAAKHEGVRTRGTRDAGGASTLEELARLAASGDLDVPIAASFPLREVRDAYRAVAGKRLRGKVVLSPQD